MSVEARMHLFRLVFYTLSPVTWLSNPCGILLNFILLNLQHSCTGSCSHEAFWTWLISSTWENRQRFICLYLSAFVVRVILRDDGSLTQHHLYSSSLADALYQPVVVLSLHSFSQKMRGTGRLIIKNEFLSWPKLTHYSPWLLLTVWISFCVPELVHLSLSGVGPWQMCQYDCRSSAPGEKHLNSPWCITLAATNLAELSSKSSGSALLLTICFLSPGEASA